MPTKITATLTNLLRSSVYSVLGTTSTGYGAGLVTRDVSVGETITPSSYLALVDDLRRCWIHQTGSLDGFLTVSELPKQGDPITLARIDQIINEVSTNKRNTVPSQQLQDSLASSTSTIYSGSGNNLIYQVDYTFRNTADANYFFNLGGSITAGLSHAAGTYAGNTATLAGFIDWANSQIRSTAYTWLQWNQGGVSTSINASYTSSTNYIVRLGIFARDNRTIRSTLTITTAALPDAPTIGTATATGTTTANVSFTAPASNGGATITSYTATSSPEGITGTLRQAGSGTITVSGLTAGTPYTFTVTATNSAGTSAASGASNSITTYSVPVNTAAPVLTGTARVGQTLTTTTGTWTGTPTPTYAYRWQRAGVDISGATSSTYTLVSADVGSAVRCVVTATNSAGSASANSNATSSVTAASVTIPVNTIAPAVSGTAIAGQTLTATTGTWTGTPTYAYRWQRAGVDISGATSSTYTLVIGDTGSDIRCVVTATNAAGSTSANSNAISVLFVATAPGAPTIGTATATGTTTANVSFTAPASNGGATITSYTATSSPGGRTGTLSQAGSGNITVTGLTAGTVYTFTVTATNSVGTSAASGASNSITTSSVPVNTVAPVVSGTATEEQTLTTTTGTWTGTPTPTYAYRWQRAGVDISGATSSTYTLVGADLGSVIRCVVTATNSAGSASANSNATSSVTAALATIPVNTVAPAVSGRAVITNTLTVTTGTWTGKPSSFTYQWQRLGVDISGATSSTYTLVREDAYDNENDPPKISCVVTARNTSGSTSAESNKIFVIFPRSPSPPQNLQIINSTDSPRTVTLAWDPPEDDGWAPISGYYVGWNSNREDANASGYYGASFGYTNGYIQSNQITIPVNDSTNYRYVVKAVNTYRISDDALLYSPTGPVGPLMSFTITPSVVNVTEGEEVTFNITPNNAAIGTSLYWFVTPDPGSEEQNDFVEWYPSGSFYYEGQPLSIKLTAKADGKTESPETFTLSLYPQPGMPYSYRYLYASATIHISD